MSFLKKITTITLCTCGINYYNICSATHLNNNYYNNNIKHHKSNYKTIKYQYNRMKSSNYYNKKVIDWNNCYKKLMIERDNFVENSIINDFMNKIGNDTLKYIHEKIPNTKNNKIVISNDNKANFKLLNKIFNEQILNIKDCNEYCMFYSLYHECFDIVVNEFVHYSKALFKIFDFYYSEHVMSSNMPNYKERPESFDNTVYLFLDASFDFYDKIKSFRYLDERYCKQLFQLSQIFSVQWNAFFGYVPYKKHIQK